MADDCVLVIVKVVIGDLKVTNPDVKSFNVTRQRGVLWASASATVELDGSIVNDTKYLGSSFSISVNDKLLFTGFVEHLDLSPKYADCEDVAVILTVSGYDKLYKLRNKKITRHIKLDPGQAWCVITAVTSSSKSEQLIESRTLNGATVVTHGVKPISKDLFGNGSKLFTHKPTDLVGAGSTFGNIVGGVPPHTHGSFDEGGPAIGVFGDYKLYTDK